MASDAYIGAGRRDVFPADQTSTLRGLLREESFLQFNASNRVKTCLLMDYLLCGRGTVEAPATPLLHHVMSSPEHLSEAFAYFYEYGAAAE